jgi:hypothetical protein
MGRANGQKCARSTLLLTCENHLGARDVSLGVEQVLEQVLLGPATKPQNQMGKQAGTARTKENNSEAAMKLAPKDRCQTLFQQRCVPYQVMPEFLLAAE